MIFNHPEIANSSASIINRILLNNKSKLKLDTTINTETIKSNTFVFYANTLNLFKAAVNQLKLELQRQPQISLIVIDSFSYHLKAMNNSFARMNLIYDMLSSLQALIVNKKIAVRYYFMLLIFNIIRLQFSIIKVVITNEMTTALFTDKNTNETKSKIVPSLGESFAHKINQRIIFQSDNKPGYFRAKIAKSLLKNTGYCNFIVSIIFIEYKTHNDFLFIIHNYF